jgi:VIT1/CCC1 family predicted Fe2+/Mn2+ transporter
MEEHFKSSDKIKDFVIGMSDGLTVPFALAAGLSGVLDDTHIIIVAGIAEIAAGSIAMGLGGYLAGTAEVNHYNAELQREYAEVENLRHKEIEETKEIFANMGLSERLQNEITEEISQDTDKWVDFMMQYELGLSKPEKGKAYQSAGIIAGSYILGGFIPLSAYFFTHDVPTGLISSCILTLICLFIFGIVKSKYTGQPLITGALKTTFIGAIAAAAAYFIAKLVSSH